MLHFSYFLCFAICVAQDDDLFNLLDPSALNGAATYGDSYNDNGYVIPASGYGGYEEPITTTTTKQPTTTTCDKKQKQTYESGRVSGGFDQRNKFGGRGFGPRKPMGPHPRFPQPNFPKFGGPGPRSNPPQGGPQFPSRRDDPRKTMFGKPNTNVEQVQPAIQPPIIVQPQGNSYSNQAYY